MIICRLKFIRIYFIVLFSLFLFIQCKEEKKQHDEFNKIVINPSEAIKLDFSKLFSSVEIIKPAGDDDIVYNKPTKLVVKNNRHYLHSQDVILVYDSHWEYLFSISQKGIGPGEYLDISDFSVEDDGRIIINDREGRKLLFYSSEGMFLKSLNHQLFSYNFFKKENLIYINSGNLINDNSKYMVNVVNEENSSIISRYFEQEKELDYLSVIEYTNFSFFSDTLSYSRSFSNIIYQLKNGNAIPRIKIDFEKNNMPESFLTKYDRLRLLMDDLQQSDFAYRIDGYYENEDIMFFSYAYLGKRPFVWYSKDKNIIYNFNKFEDDLLFPNLTQDTSYDFLPICIDDDFVYISINSYTLIELVEKIKETMSLEGWNKYLEKQKILKTIISNIDADSNAVILKYKINSSFIIRDTLCGKSAK